MSTYDVVISGASIAGLYCGYHLAKAGLSVCIVDRRDAIGTPVRCGEATGNRKEIERFVPYDKSYIACEISGLAAHHNREERISVDVKDTGVILKRDRFEQYMASLAEAEGAVIRLEHTVVELIRGEEQRWSGVKLQSGELLTGRYVIAADGAESFLGRAAGLTQHLKPYDAFTSLQYRVKGERWNDGKMHFFLGREIVPNGYIWVFPRGDGELSIGAGLYGSHRKGELASAYLESFLNTYYPTAERSHLITGCAPLNVAPKELVSGNLLLVGDAARMVNPLSAGGIMNALEAGEILCDSLLLAEKKGRLSLLKRYSKKWRGMPRFTQKVFYVSKELLLESSDVDMDRGISVAYRLLSKVDRSKLFSIPLGSIPLLMRLYFVGLIKRIPFLLRG